MRRAAVSLVIVALVISTASVAAADGPRVRTVVSFDAAQGQLPEGVAVTDRGAIYVGFAPTGEIVKVRPNGTVSHVATLPKGDGFLVGMALDSNDRLVALPTDAFPNAIAFRNGAMFVTDSFGGAVWRIRGDHARVWIQDDLLLGDTSTELPIGANGLAFLGRYLYVANSQKGRLVRIPVQRGGSAGTPVVLVEDERIVGADGIEFDVRGNLYVAVNEQDTLVRIGPSGGMETLATRADGLDFPATPVFGESRRHRTDLYLSNFALDLDRHPNPALLVLDVGVAGKRLP